MYQHDSSQSNTACFSLPKIKRIAKSADFRQVYQSNYWGGTKLFSFNAQPSSYNRFGVTVSKKVSKLAVTRNRIRRLAKEFYRHNNNQLDSTDLVLTAKLAAGHASNVEIQADLNELWLKVMKWRRWYNRTQT